MFISNLRAFDSLLLKLIKQFSSALTKYLFQCLGHVILIPFFLVYCICGTLRTELGVCLFIFSSCVIRINCC